MKLKNTLAIGLCGLASAAGLHAQPINLPGASSLPPAMAAAPAAPAATFTDAQVLEIIGWVMGKQSQAETFEFTADQLAIVQKGFGEAAADKSAPFDLDKIGPQVAVFAQKRQDAYVTKLKAKGTAEGDKFFADLKKKQGVTLTASGLGYEIMKAGAGPNVKTTDTVRANYTGTLIDGTVFDSTKPPAGQPGAAQPAEFAMTEVVPGWTEGLQKINKGGVIKLYIPSKLAYGEEGHPDIPPNSTLIFEIEILDIKPTPGPGSIGPVMPGGK